MLRTDARRSRGYHRNGQRTISQRPACRPGTSQCPKRHHAQRPQHSKRRSAVIPALEDAPFTSEVYDKAFADFAMSNLGISIATNASAKAKPEGNTSGTMNIS